MVDRIDQQVAQRLADEVHDLAVELDILALQFEADVLSDPPA